MSINPLITSKVDSQPVPDKIKEIIHEILAAEVKMGSLGERRNAPSNLSKILEKYADDPDVVEFCGRE
ncbi:MAG: hypothetical protein MPK30_06005 [Gammaproteobacteria bacterium]|nr:hypothetical protein [Gammaproteobacteria bacterium]